MDQLKELPIPLLLWYRENARVLPWRSHPTPYRVWVSEIMLQQTRVAAVLDYYRRFLEALPTVADLAAVPEDALMKLWQGLGYYSRARNLQRAARQIMEEHGGIFPSTYEEIRALSGVGDYTAGAISSIAFGLPVPAVDGNVLRVAARVTGDEGDIAAPATKKRVTAALAEIIPLDAPGDFNQAMMELGATVCLPNGAPVCDLCPAAEFCVARLEERMDALHDAAFNSPVTEDHLAKVIELWSGIPASKVKESELQKVADLETGLKRRIIGQDEAVNAVAAAVRRSRIRLSAKKRPASFIFVGPTGVGKTELVKVLSEELFDNVEPLIRLDMSEFMEKHSVSRIIGSPPGYVGYDEAGQLTEKVRRRPYSIVLFDEIEKAHPDVMNILLQILDEGRITDAQGRQVSFENTIIIMTSNAGSERQGSALGFDKTRYDDAKDKAETSLRQFLRPEFLARVDEVVVFRPLTEADMEKIAALMLEELKKGLAEREIKFGWDDGVLRLAATEAYGHKSGARDLRNVLRRRVEDPICTLLAGCPEQPPALIHAEEKDGEIVLVTA